VRWRSLEPILNGRPGLRGSEPGIAGEPTYGADGDTTSDGSAAPAKFAYTARDQLSSITPHGGTATAIVSHGTGQEDLAAIGSEENIQNVLGVASTGTGTSATYYTRTNNGQLLAKRKPGENRPKRSTICSTPYGSPAMLTSATGTQTAPTSGSYQYDSYGSAIGTGPTTFGYRSGQLLPDNLIHYGARYYGQADASWTQEDPASQIADLTQADIYGYTDGKSNQEDRLLGEDVLDYAKSYAVSGGTGAAANSIDPAGSAASGFAAGCAEGLGSQFLKETGHKTLGTFVEFAGAEGSIRGRRAWD
jgi:hypothetical protein